MENRSLDDFLDGEDRVDGTDEADEAGGSNGADDSSGADAEGSDSADGPADGDAVRVDPGGIEPAEATYAAGAGECAACGASVRERWRGEAGLVCPACKDW